MQKINKSVFTIYKKWGNKCDEILKMSPDVISWLDVMIIIMIHGDQAGSLWNQSSSRGRLHRLQKEVWLNGSLWENDSNSHLIYYLNKHFTFEFMVLIASFKTSSIQHDFHCVNYGSI